MAPKKIVPKGTDDIIELTDIVEEGKLPLEDTGKGLTDASFEDELDSMLADVPELSAAEKELAAMAGPVAATAYTAPAASAGDDDLADLDSLLEGLDDNPDVKPPAPKTVVPAVDDNASVDDFLAEFADVDNIVQPDGAAVPSVSSIDGATVDADDLLAELQIAVEPVAAEDDLLAELKSVMGGDPAAEAAPAPEAPEAPADPFEAAMAAAAPAAADPFEAAMAAAKPAPADPFEVAMAAAEPVAEPVAPLVEEDLADLAEVALAPEAPAAEGPLAAEDLQQLDALLDDILQPGSASGPAPAEAETPAAPAPQAVMPEETAAAASSVVAAPVDTAALAAELLADDGPLLATVRDLVRQELEERMAALEERLTQNLDKSAAQAAAQIIREEIAALAQDLMD